MNFTGEKYEEVKSLSTTDITKLIRKEIREKYKGMKISVTSEHFSGGSAINITIKECGFNPINTEWNPKEEDMQLRKSKYNEEGESLLKELEEVANKYNYDRSDVMTDYFDVMFYLHVNYGWESEEEWIKEATENIKYSNDKGVIRYKKTDDREVFKKQLNDFVEESKKGKVICISDLMINAESQIERRIDNEG